MIKEIKIFCLIFAFTFLQNVTAQNPSALYQNWVDAQVNNTTPILPTFSYAGYHNGEIAIPRDLTLTVFDVTTYGAIADDGVSDKVAIMNTIVAAEANADGGIVFFPPGRFIIQDSSVDDSTESIKITKSNIILKGSGSGQGGTELYQKDNTTHPDMATKPFVCPYIILFTNNKSSTNTFITNVTGNTSRETFTVQVDNTTNIAVNQWVELYVKNDDDAFIAQEFAPFTAANFENPNNLDIVKNGVEVREIHKVVSKTANSITFKEPIHYDIDSQFGWKINDYDFIEEVGIQDLKFTGGYIWNFLHHRAPQELFPGEAAGGPNAFLSDSGWSGIQLRKVLNGWIKNVEFSNVSRAAQLGFSKNVSAIDNTYTGNPSHNFIVANNSTGCLIGRNIDSSSGVWHGAGVAGNSIGNVIWRSEHPANSESGMELHASQPRTTLFDKCKGGFFFNMGGAGNSLPNHLKHLVLWNFDGVAPNLNAAISWKDNGNVKIQTPIISGLKGFKMSQNANQFQVNESEGTHVDETSLYEKQLEYRLGKLPDWITDTAPKETIIYAEDFRFESFDRGFEAKIIDGGGYPDANNDLVRRFTNENLFPKPENSNNLFNVNEDRQAIRIPEGRDADRAVIRIHGSKSGTNYATDVYVVFTTLDLTASNPRIDEDDTNKFATFWTSREFGDADIADVLFKVSTDYTGDPITSNWTTVPLLSGKIAVDADNDAFVKGIIDLTSFANGANGNTVTLALHYKGKDDDFNVTGNRNGFFVVSDLQFVTQSFDITDVWGGTTDSNFDDATNWLTKASPKGTTNTLKIPAGLANYPTINTSLTANKIIIEAGGTFIAEAPVNANVIYERILETPSETGNFVIDSLEGWYLMSSPVSGEVYDNSWADTNEIANGSNSNRGLATYNNTVANNNWNYFNGTATSFLNGQGYAIKRATTGKVSFLGTMNTSNITNVAISEGETTYNLLGNPFTAFVNTKTLLDFSSNSNILASKTIWIWNSNTKNYEAKLSGDATTYQIAPGQGFFVKASSSGNFSFNTAMRSHQTTDTFQKKNNTMPEIRLNISANGLKRFTEIRYLDTATKSFDNGFDGETFTGNSNKLDVFSHLLENSNGTNYQLQAVPNSDYEQLAIPIGIISETQETVTFTVDAKNIPADYKVYLEDKTANTVTNLSDVNTSYQVPVDAAETLGRFYLHLNTSPALSTENEFMLGVQIFKSDDILRIIGLNDGNAEIELYNIIGSKVFSNKFRATNNNYIDLPDLKTGIYIVNLKTKDGKLNKKIIVE